MLTDVSFALHAGERIGVLGPNGGGKTTLFRVLLGELAPLAGTLRAPARFAVVPQTERSRLDFPVSALDVALMGSISTLPWWRRPGRAQRRAARAALGAVGLGEQADATFGDLSGGQRQRVLVARALVQDARVILLDEPFTGLDAPSADRLEALLAELAAEGAGVMIATHDVDQARGWDSVLCLNRRQVAFGPPEATLHRAVLGGHLRRRDRRAARRRAARGGPAPSPLMLAALHTLTDPWADPVGRRALLEVALLGVAGGALGCWIVFYNLSYSAESLAHALLPGLVLAALTGIPLLLGGAAGLLVAAVAIAAAGQVPAIGRDTAVAVVVTTLFGAGVLLALSPSSPPGLQGLLFGDVLGVSNTDLGLAAGLAVLVLAALALLHARLLAVGFDRLSAPGIGVRPLVVDLALLVLVALALLVAVQGLGNLLVVAVFVAPASAARLVARRMGPMMAVSAAVAVVAGVGGLYLSYYAGTAAGASIAAMLVAAYLLAGVSRGVAARAPGAK